MAQRRYLNTRRGDHPFDYCPDAARPNILLITVDMIPHESYAPGSHIREHLRTPNMDRLMDDGTRFVNAFSASPLCGPSRACYLTGRYPYLTVNDERAHDGSETVLRASDAIFPEYLRATGYVTRHAGKCHVGTGKFMEAFGENDAPWDRWAPPMEDDDGYVRYLADLGLRPPVWAQPLRGLRPDRVTPGNGYGGWLTQPDGEDFPEEGTYSQYLAWLAGASLRAAAAQASGGPIYLQLDFFAPHQPFFIPSAYRERARELREQIELPDSYYEALGGKGGDWPRVYHFYRANWGLYDEDTAREYMLLNMLQIEALDAALGRFLATLDEQGLYDDSLIIFSGDHGEMNCERALVDKGVYGHPKTARVPLSVKMPGGQGAGQICESLVSLLDVAPTVLEATGVSPAERLDGESLVPFVLGQKQERDEPFLFECGWHVCPNPAVSTFARLDDGRQFMYTYNLTSEFDELYDLGDSGYTNLATDRAFADEHAEMIRRLAAIMDGDPRWVCYWHTFRLDKYDLLQVGEGDFQMFKPEH